MPSASPLPGSYNISPAVSPDGRWLAYISRVGGAFKLHVMELATGTVTPITETSADESPSFAPNSRLIVYATQQQGREALMTTTLDGKIKAQPVRRQRRHSRARLGPLRADAALGIFRLFNRQPAHFSFLQEVLHETHRFSIISSPSLAATLTACGSGVKLERRACRRPYRPGYPQAATRRAPTAAQASVATRGDPGADVAHRARPMWPRSSTLTSTVTWSSPSSRARSKPIPSS